MGAEISKSSSAARGASSSSRPSSGAAPSRSAGAASQFRTIADQFQTIDQVQNALRQQGLESSSLIVAVDFTKSNEWTGKHSNGGRSLHALGATPNPYEMAITIVARTLAAFDDDGLIPTLGFGDASTQDQAVFSFFPGGAPAPSLNALNARYRELVPHVKLAGPTSFAPAIHEAMRIVAASGNQYHILVIVADGQVTRSSDMPANVLSTQEEATVRAIVAASALPLSIIMVGVGDGPWDVMREFDDRLPARKWDNFQFVNFTEVLQRYHGDPARLEAQFALNALMEIPEQFQTIQRMQMLSRRSNVNVPTRRPLEPPAPTYAPPPVAYTQTYAPPGSFSAYGAPPQPSYQSMPSFHATPSFGGGSYPGQVHPAYGRPQPTAQSFAYGQTAANAAAAAVAGGHQGGAAYGGQHQQQQQQGYGGPPQHPQAYGGPPQQQQAGNPFTTGAPPAPPAAHSSNPFTTGVPPAPPAAPGGCAAAMAGGAGGGGGGGGCAAAMAGDSGHGYLPYGGEARPSPTRSSAAGPSAAGPSAAGPPPFGSGPSGSMLRSGGGEPDALFVCPITQEVMSDPVIAADGYTYDRHAIAQWFATHNTSPMSNAVLPHTQLTPNNALRSSIMEWKERSGKA